MKMEIIENPLLRFVAYVLTVSLFSLVLQSTAPILGQYLIMPVFVPLALIGLTLPGLGNLAIYLDVDVGSTAAFLFRGLTTGLVWGGCIVFPLDRYHLTKNKNYKIAAIAFGAYSFFVLLTAAVFYLMLANSGWGD
jgi:hypothetical protein